MRDACGCPTLDESSQTAVSNACPGKNLPGQHHHYSRVEHRTSSIEDGGGLSQAPTVSEGRRDMNGLMPLRCDNKTTRPSLRVCVEMFGGETGPAFSAFGVLSKPPRRWTMAVSVGDRRVSDRRPPRQAMAVRRPFGYAGMQGTEQKSSTDGDGRTRTGLPTDRQQGWPFSNLKDFLVFRGQLGLTSGHLERTFWG